MTDDREALARLLEATAEAENCARQLALYTGRKDWILVAANFGKIGEVCKYIATRRSGGLIGLA